MKLFSTLRISVKRYIYKSCIALAFGVLFFLSGCNSAKLQALENSVSTVELTTGREVRRSLTDEHRGFITGGIYDPEVLIVYEPIDNHTKQEVFEEIGAVLKKNNWRDYGRANLDYSGTFYYFRTFLQYDGYPVTVWVNTSPDKNEVVLIVEEDSPFYHSPTSIPLLTPVPRATNATPELKMDSTMMKGRDGMTLLYVHAGEFTMGSDNGERGEKPVHTVYLDAFWIDQTEVTNEMYAKCMEVGQCDPPNTSSIDYISISSYAKHPVVYMDWKTANAYCSWVGRRLPTEAEWEKAARGTDERTYPWGEGIDCYKANYQNNCVGDTSPVGRYEGGKSPYGAHDMAGNAWELVNDWYGETYYQSSPSSNPSGPDSGKYRVRRGGSWNSFDYVARSAFHYANNPMLTDYSIGFRCARSVP